jgi:uncharacterized damage-inducible protein DinB
MIPCAQGSLDDPKRSEEGPLVVEPLTLRTAMLGELEGEQSRTLRTLERVPSERWTWAPHEKSTPMGRLAVHLATLPQVAVSILTTSELDVATRVAGDGPPPPQTAADLVPAAQAQFHKVRQLLEEASDQDLEAEWTLRFGDRVLFGPGPRAAGLRTVFSHMIHHRAQLGVYLRLNGIPVPAIYGPSADEPLPG